MKNNTRRVGGVLHEDVRQAFFSGPMDIKDPNEAKQSEKSSSFLFLIFQLL